VGWSSSMSRWQCRPISTMEIDTLTVYEWSDWGRFAGSSKRPRRRGGGARPDRPSTPLLGTLKAPEPFALVPECPHLSRHATRATSRYITPSLTTRPASRAVETV